MLQLYIIGYEITRRYTTIFYCLMTPRTDVSSTNFVPMEGMFHSAAKLNEFKSTRKKKEIRKFEIWICENMNINFII